MLISASFRPLPRTGRGWRQGSRVLATWLVVSAILGQQTMALDTIWSGASSALWSTAGNWDNGVPTVSSNAYLPSPSAGNSQITIPAGAVANQLIVNATYQLLGGSLTLSDNFYVDSTSGNLTLGTGVTVNTPNATIGISSNALSNQLLISGTGSALTVTNSLNVGWDGQQNSLTAQGGGHVTTATTNIGALSTSTNNTATVSGTGSALSATNMLYVGDNGTNNAMTVSGGASASTLKTWVGNNASATGNALNVSGSGSSFTANTNSTSQFVLGISGSNNSFNLSGGATATTLQTLIGNFAGSNGNAATVSGTGSVWTVPNSTNAALAIGLGGSNNSVTISNAGKLSMSGARDAQIGANTGANGNSLTVMDATSEFENAATLYVGNSGSNNLANVQNGGKITSNNVRVGGAATSSGNIATVDGAGSLWNVSNTFRLGSAGTSNQLNITGGGKVTLPNNDMFVGYATGSSNNVLTIAGAGSELTMGAGKNVVIEYEGGSTSSASTTGNMVVVKDGGYLNGSSVKLGPYATLKFGDGAAPGTIKAGSTVNAPYGGGTVEFNHNSSAFTYADALTGSLRVQQTGPGTTILTGTKDYTGTTDVNAGELRVNGSTSASSVVTVAAGATLSGSGTVGGATTVNGTTSPGDGVGQQSFSSNLTYNSGSSLKWELASNTNSNTAQYDRTQVGGNLAFNGSALAILSFNGSGSSVNWSDGFWAGGHQWSIYNVTGTTTGSNYMNVTSANWADSNGGLFNTLRPGAYFYITQAGSNLLLTYNVPEPSAWLLATVGLAACWALNLSRKKVSRRALA